MLSTQVNWADITSLPNIYYKLNYHQKNKNKKAFVLCRLFDNREKSTNGGPAASLDTSSCIEETKSKSSRAPVFPALDVQTETHQTKKQEAEMTSPEDEFNVEEFFNKLFPSASDFYVDEMMSDATVPIQFNNDNFNSEVDQDLEKGPKMFYPHPPEPLDCNFSSPSTLTSVTPAVSFPTSVKASLEEAQSMLVPASVSPDLGSEADNYPMSFQCCPAENSDGMTSSIIPPIEYNGYNTCVAKNDVVEKTSDEVEAGWNMFPVTPQPLGCNTLSPLHSQMQADDCFRFKSSSQNNLAFDDETQENMLSAQNCDIQDPDQDFSNPQTPLQSETSTVDTFMYNAICILYLWDITLFSHGVDILVIPNTFSCMMLMSTRQVWSSYKENLTSAICHHPLVL
ncbi:uncharacterized protein LOC136061211 [Quercus suber]|uniref:uncharacterized protein LOC136061211 n=1 Tax=Quercus suber TaxID=58331 RepID=UPI0032DF2813